MRYSEQTLLESRDMRPVFASVDVPVPADELWTAFSNPSLWPRWNRCFYWARNRDLGLGAALIWCFEPIKWWLPYKMPAIARIVELVRGERVTWEVTALPGFYARHTYRVESLPNGGSRFSSWEQAQGWGFRLTKWFWIRHFQFVCDESMRGADNLVKACTGGPLDAGRLPRRRYWPFWLGVLAILIGVAVASTAIWFYFAFVRLDVVPVGQDAFAVLHAGGNSLVIDAGSEVIVVDTKFSPGAGMLQRWIARNIRDPVAHVVNTHYHYDHTFGNHLYPGARIYAHRTVPDEMRDTETGKKYLAAYPAAVPTELIDDRRALVVGTTTIEFIHPGRGHTHGDLVVFVPKLNVVALGDLMFNGYYPFLDVHPDRGGSIAPMIAALRDLARRHPDATFIPGHGTLTDAKGVLEYSEFLDYLQESVLRCIKEGLTEQQIVDRVDLSRWKLSVLPSFPDGLIPEWATAEHTLRSAYRLLSQPSTSAPSAGDRP